MRRGVMALVLAAVVAGCGSSASKSGETKLRWYVFDEPSLAYQKAAKKCSKESKRYDIEIAPLPTDANQQRELIVRRLAAKDSDVDLIGMDVIWTAEFAQAGWIKEWTGENKRRATEGTGAAPLKTAVFENKLWATPFTTNTQLLWYRKDLVKKPPQTWDEMFKMSDDLKKQGKPSLIEVQGSRYEGLTVWFNTLVASAGGSIVNEQGVPQLGPPAVRAAEVMKHLASNPATADPSLASNREDQARLAFQNGKAAFQLNYSFIYASAAGEAKKFVPKIGWALYPRVDKDKHSRVTLGGINLGVGAYSKHPDLAYEAALCLRQPANQIEAAVAGGLPPTTSRLFETKEVKKAFPFAKDMKESLATGVPRPVTPAYSDVSLAVSGALVPEADIQPQQTIDDLKANLQKVKDGGIF